MCRGEVEHVESGMKVSRRGLRKIGQGKRPSYQNIWEWVLSDMNAQQRIWEISCRSLSFGKDVSKSN